ncbi:MAG TPA: phosphatase PAP2 family protein [Chloroflexota bacterium]|nr:phosphatase PAP2 family protein [Chloroflexota bacterium]
MALPAFSAPSTPRHHPRARSRGVVTYHRSSLAVAWVVILMGAFAAFTAVRGSGTTTQLDLRIVADLVPIRDHHRLLKLLHPLVHLADGWFVVSVTMLVVLTLWARGYKHPWALLLGFLSWPIELACKTLFPQPTGLYTGHATVQIRDLVHGPGATALLDWLHNAAPGGVGTLVQSAGGATLGLASSYPSGTTARGAFVIGLLAWACLRLGGSSLGVLLATLLFVPLSTLGLAVVLYAWHWPSDVVGGYLLGIGLLAAGLAIQRRPIRADVAVVDPPGRGRPVSLDAAMLQPSGQKGPHSPYSRLPWTRSDG